MEVTPLKRKNPTSSSSVVTGSFSIPIDAKRPKNELNCYASNNYNSNSNNGVNNNDDLMVRIDDDRHQINIVAPLGFLDPLPPLERELVNVGHNSNITKSNNSNNHNNDNNNNNNGGVNKSELQKCRKQFWKAGDYEAPRVDNGNYSSNSSNSAGLDHVRVHPRFLHSNATSHKWALGAFAELLDNALDEVCNGATYVSVDMVYNEKDHSKMLLADKDRNRMLLIEDNGGGMNPDKIRQCMYLGYSAKSKIANTIGQYGNGFKTSTMRLGADVIVFSMCPEKDGISATRSIGMISYTFLTSTGMEDIAVPMIDYEKKGNTWTKMVRSSLEDWHLNLETIIQWSPFASEQDLLQQFNFSINQGTRIFVYNLWEDDDGQLELDFCSDPDDIQIRGVNRDEKKIAMAEKYPNSKHFLTYQHSLRSYASILYLNLPPGFRILLRGKDVLHHSLVTDMMHQKQVSYKPVPINNGTVKDSTALSESVHALVTIGFAKDATDHIDIQGFNVYHKNRLIKPFWRVWNAAGSDGRGVIGVLEANFVEPAHDKHSFEKTTALSRLESRLIVLQKSYWRDHCHEIGYAPRRQANKFTTTVSLLSSKGHTTKGTSAKRTDDNNCKTAENSLRNSVRNSEQRLPIVEFSSEDEMEAHSESPPLPKPQSCRPKAEVPEQIYGNLHTVSEMKAELLKLRKENSKLKISLREASEARDQCLQSLQFEKDKCKSFESQLEAANKKSVEMDNEQEALIKIFSEERERRDIEEENLRNHLQDALTRIEQFKMLERIKLPECKPEI